MRNLRRNKKGATNILMALITIAIMMLVAIIIVNALVNSVTPDDTWSEEANNTWDDTQTYIWLGFGLVAISIVVLAAYAILSSMKMSG